ncbi:BNR repeat domain protein [Minicystis rosea]|nr:BNR repeat domain protein [Minicystis rosea]
MSVRAMLVSIVALATFSCGGSSPETATGTGGASVTSSQASTSDASSSSAVASSSSSTGGVGGAGGAAPKPDLVLDVEAPPASWSFERGSLVLHAHVRAPEGSSLELADADGTLDQASTGSIDGTTDQTVELTVPFARGPHDLEIHLRAEDGREAQRALHVHGGRQVAATLEHMLAIKNGTLYDWGGGSPELRSWPELAQTTAIHARSSISIAVAIDREGDAYAIDLVEGVADPLLTGEDIVAAALGGGHVLLLRADGILRVAGANDVGQLGLGSTEAIDGFATVTGVSGIVAVGATDDASYAVREDGVLFAWGGNESGELGLGVEDAAPHATPAIVPTVSDVIGVAGGRSHVLALRRDGAVLAWGTGSSGQLGDGTSGILADKSQPIKTMSAVPMLDVFAAGNASFALGEDGALWAWGQNSGAQLGVGDTTQRVLPTRNGVDFARALGAGPTGSMAVDLTDRVFAWGANTSGQLALPLPPDGPTRSTTPIEIVLP